MSIFFPNTRGWLKKAQNTTAFNRLNRSPKTKKLIQMWGHPTSWHEPRYHAVEQTNSSQALLSQSIGCPGASDMQRRMLSTLAH